MTGSFRADDNSRCTLQISGTGIDENDGGLIFPYDSPIEIEWEETDKITPIQPSAMTVRLISRSDREFVDLYTVEAGGIMGTFYNTSKNIKWVGTLDPESYEEPYSTRDGYEVELTFTDFGILQRLKSDFTGIRSLDYIIRQALTRAKLDDSRLRYLISSSMPYETEPLSLENLYIDTANFKDEDGEPMTLEEVLTSILQPLALRMVQKGQYIYIYDINALYNRGTAQRIDWDNTDSILGVDSVYNDVTLTFSPYSRKEIVNSEISTDDLPKETTTDSITVYKFNKETDVNANPDAFKLIIYKENPTGDAVGNVELSDRLKVFRIKPIYSGSDEAGYIYGACSNLLGGNYSRNLLLALPTGNESFGKIDGWNNDGSNLDAINQTAMITTQPQYIQHNLSSEYQLKVCLSVLFSPLFNPFESSESNESGNESNFKNWCNFGYIPCRLTLRDESGAVLYHYSNLEVYKQNNFNGLKGKWVSGNCKIGEFMLAYYDWDNRKSETGFLGWKVNKQCIGYYRGGLPKSMSVKGDGEFIQLPPVDGYLVLEIGEGVIQFDYKRESKDAWGRARWLLYKDIQMSLVNEYGKDVELEDVELKAWLNKAAKDGYTIDTTSGSFCKGVAPTSRGVIFYKKNGSYMPLQQLSRADVLDTPERLLIGTIYSQYSQRHVTLSGTVRLLPDLSAYTDAATPGKFMLLSEVWDVRADTSEVKLSLLTEEEYQGIEYYE